MTPAPMKDSSENDSRLQHGVRDIDEPDDAKFDKRDVSLEMHLTAQTEDKFLTNYILYNFINLCSYDTSTDER